ncbi:MAG: hypothetical protein V4492_04315 [Chlamydiota bacterium]
MAFSSKFLHLIYPPLCSHCQRRVEDQRPFFCTSCLDYLTLLEAKGRCPLCFTECSSGACSRCRQRSTAVHSQCAALEPLGPGRTLARYAQRKDPQAISAAASLMAYQWIKLDKKMPDLLLPMPISRWDKWMRNRSADQLLAEALAPLFGVPVVNALEKSWDHRHFLATAEMRNRFQWNGNTELTDKSILLISCALDDERIRRAALALQEAFPSRIDALALYT